MNDAVDVTELVRAADLGGRKPAGAARAIMASTCIVWSLLQLWYASPLPFTFNTFILNDTEMRSLLTGIVVIYLVLLRIVAAEPDLVIDDRSADVIELPPLKETILAGLLYLRPVVLLIWVLMIEHLSPACRLFAQPHC